MSDARAIGLIGWYCRVTVPLLSILCSLPAVAHDRTTSYSSWEVRGRRAQITARMSALDVSRLPWAASAGRDLDGALGSYVTQHLELFSGDSPCAVDDGPRRLKTAPDRVVYEWAATCSATGDLRIQSGLFLDVAASHLHFARLTRDGGGTLERVLSDHARTWTLPTDASGRPTQTQGTSVGGYVMLGIEHILSGYDHLAFVFALLLIGGTLTEVAKVVTGFTVAHSLTLALTVLGYIRPDGAPIEALIGLSIALVAAENMWLIGARGPAVPHVIAMVLALLAVIAWCGYGRVPALTLAGLSMFAWCYFGLLRRVARAAALRWGVAFIFGLVHGFGFAAVLSEAGLPTDRVVHALFGFNAGVEIGQLAVVAAVWPTLRFLTRGRLRMRQSIIEIGSAAVLALGVFWFVTRTFG